LLLSSAIISIGWVVLGGGRSFYVPLVCQLASAALALVLADAFFLGSPISKLPSRISAGKPHPRILHLAGFRTMQDEPIQKGLAQVTR
jgi:hypothetical protein